jgi:hypothetical protein
VAVRVVHGGRVIEVTWSQIDTWSGDPGNEQKLETARGWLQDQLDVRTRRTRLPQNDPDRSIDPALPHLFWDGQDLVGREVTVERVVYDPAADAYWIELRSTRSPE